MDHQEDVVAVKTYSVFVYDMRQYLDPEGESTVTGFATEDLANEYARRRTRSAFDEARSDDFENVNRI
jgi:hypothetical protein